MLRNLLKLATRNFFREKTFTTINIIGLALGCCSAVAIFTITKYEFSFDAFHPNGGRIYRLMMEVTEGTGNKIQFARSPVPLAASVRQKLPGLQAIASVISYPASIKVAGGGNDSKTFDSYAAGSHFSTTVIAEPQWFSLFHYTWLAGDQLKPLIEPGHTILTESRARQYFGNIPLNEMIGKQVVYNDSLPTTVSGIVQDWPATTDIGFTDFISWPSLTTPFLKNNINTASWQQRQMRAFTFVQLHNSASVAASNTQLANVLKAASTETTTPTPWLQPLADMHFDADIIENDIRTAHRPTLYALLVIAAFILLLAIINFINLSTAQLIRRNREAGIRKVLGSGRAALVIQYLTETFLLTVIAVLLALTFVQPVLNAFHNFLPAGLSFNWGNAQLWLFVLGITVTVTLLSGWYPARAFSSTKPALMLRNSEQKGGNQWWLRKGLIVFQFSVSLVFITGVIVMKTQMNYIRHKDLGFNPGAIVLLNAPPNDSLSKLSVLENRIQQLPGITATAQQWVPPLVGNGRGRDIKLHPADTKETAVVQVSGDEHFIPLYNIQLLAGRNLQPADTMKEIIINETLCRLMGYTDPANVIGKPVYWSDIPYPVVGVVKDFHTRSLHESISPLCMVHRKDRERTLAVKFSTGNLQGLLLQLENIWKTVYPATAFSYTFYDETLAQLYEKDRQTATLIDVSMAITIFISCFGLFGLALFTAQKRAKEISIRKILGASAAQLVVMLCKEFTRLVGIGLLVAIPVAWYFSNEWLNNFAYRVSVSWWMFVLAGLAAAIITLLTIGFQALKAALVNPVKNLRRE